MDQFWVLVGVVGMVLVLLLIGLVIGFASFKSRTVRGSAARGMMALDAALLGADRRAAIEYVLQDQDEVVLDDEHGDDDGDGDEGETLVVFIGDDALD
jgi:hypothetical protein